MARGVLAQALLYHHGIPPGAVDPHFMSDSEMVNRYYSGDIDVGFFVSHVPSQVLRPVVDDTETVLLSLEPQARLRLLGPTLQTDTIESETYACQADGAPAIQTLATRAVLVTTEDVSANIGTITRLILEGAGFMRITGGMEAMAEDLPSIPLHADAEEYYREAGLLPRRPTFAQALFDWLSVTWRTLAVFLMIAAAYKGIIGLKRDHAADKIYRRALASFVRPPYARDGQTLSGSPRRDQRTRRAKMVGAGRVGPCAMA